MCFVWCWYVQQWCICNLGTGLSNHVWWESNRTRRHCKHTHACSSMFGTCPERYSFLYTSVACAFPPQLSYLSCVFVCKSEIWREWQHVSCCEYMVRSNWDFERFPCSVCPSHVLSEFIHQCVGRGTHVQNVVGVLYFHSRLGLHLHGNWFERALLLALLSCRCTLW